MTELCDLALKYMIDKCPSWGHSYTTWYYGEFKDRREQVRKVLEIGVGGSPDNLKHNPNYITGASLYMWRDFFPKAHIYGIDVLPQLMFQTERIDTYLCDQRDSKGLLAILAEIGYDLDLVIDDATHRPADQVTTALTILPTLEAGALYVIEDIFDPSIVKNFQDYNCQLVCSWKKLKRDDRLIVIRL